MKIRFTNFWGGFDPRSFFILKLLEENDVSYEVVDEGEDVHLFSVFGQTKPTNSTAKLKICYSGEPVFDNANADYVIGFREDGNRLIQIKNYERTYYEYHGKTDVYSSLTHASYDPEKKFCLFAVSNPSCLIRNEFFQYLSNYKHIDSVGKVFNNLDCKIRRQDADLWEDYIGQYNFMITFENVSHDDYVTEKIYHAMRGGVIPIYWGAPNVQMDFNKGSFLHIENDRKNIKFQTCLDLVKIIEEYHEHMPFSKYPYARDPESSDLRFERNLNRILDIFKNPCIVGT